MSDQNQTDTLLVFVRREVREVVAFTVPKGWNPDQWDLAQLLNCPQPLPAYQLPYWDPDAMRAWPDAYTFAGLGETATDAWLRDFPGAKLVPGIIDAREMIETMPTGYDPDALRKFQEAGSKAWAGVPDAAAWVRDLRGGNL